MHVVLLAVVYAAVARSGLLLASVHGSVSPVWPATGVAIGALLLGGTRLWPGVLAGAFLANALTAQPLAVAAIIAAGNTLEALAGAWLWRGVVRGVPGLHEFRDVTAAVVVSVVAPVISATIGIGSLVMTGTTAALTGKLWFTWWAADAGGALLVVPVLLARDDLLRLIRGATPGDGVRAIAVVVIALGVSGLGFVLPHGGVFLFAIFPVILLGASWFGAAGARVLGLLISAAGIAAACTGRGPFTGGDLNQSLLTLQVFLAAIAISALVLPAFRSTRNGWLPGMVLLAGWTLSGWMFLLIQRAELRREEQFFTDRVAEAQAVIRVRLTSYIDALRGGAIFYTASKSVQREDWRVYTESLDIDQRLPAINGIGVIFVVRPGHEAEWLARARADGVPSLEIKPFPDHKEAPGDVRYVVTYLAPQSRATTDTFGRDIATEPTRRAAAEAARDAGEPRFHHRAAGSRDMQRRSGLLLYMPLYAKGAPVATIAERRAACIGWVYAQVFPDTLLKAVLGPVGGVLQLDFFEAGGLTRDRLLYSSQPATTTAAAPVFERVTELEIAGQPFQLGWRRGPKFPVTEKSPTVWAAASFAVATMLLAGLVLNLQAIGRRASAIAAERTAALAASEERFRSAFEDAGIGMALVSLEGRFLRVNRALAQIVGYSPTDLLAMTFQDMTHAEDLAADVGQMRSLIAGVGSSYDIEKRYIHREGHIVWIHLTASVVRDTAGRPMHFISQIEDISERRRLEQNLAQARDQALTASRLKSEFMANMSHEIRTPMNAVSGMATLLAETNLTTEQRRMTRVIQTGSESLVAIINDILDFSRIEAGRLRLEPTDFDLRPLLEETISLFGAQAQKKGIRLDTEFALAGPAYLVGDAGRVRQVLGNLISNAVKFTERGSVVVAARTTVEASTHLGVRVEVTDTGIGIPPSAREHLFEPFTQADGSVTRRHGGTGLGLAISRQILEAMGGRIGYESEVGRGTTFWFELELPRAAGEAPPSPGIIPPNCRVLIVDDNADDSDILVHELGRAGVAADVINDPQVALGNLRMGVDAGRHWQAVFLDCRMPGKSGIELAKEIRADPGLARTPLVLLSAFGAGEHPPGVETAGFDAFLTKPARRDALRECLARLVRPSRVEVAPVAVVSDAPPKALRLLVVEDNTANQMVICMLLHKYGHTADVAENGEVALARLRTQSYDAILMDCQMPVMDGFEATRRIRAGVVAAVDPRIPIIAVTAHALPQDRVQCMEAGMNDFLTKPVRPPELTAALARWVMGVTDPESQATAPQVESSPS